MERKCPLLLIIAMLAYTCMSLFSGCGKKVYITEEGVTIIADSEDSTVADIPESNSDAFPLEEAGLTFEESEAELLGIPIPPVDRDETPVVVKTRRESLLSQDDSRETARVKKIARKQLDRSTEKESLNDDNSRKSAFLNTPPGHELWIIEKSASTITEDHKIAPPQLYAIHTKEKNKVALPLIGTSVDAHISGYIASVDVLQKYHNPYAEKIEAVYVFPLPQSAAVTDFLMIIGDRKIRGLVREKEEAKRIYQEAKAQGFKTSLLTQERPNIFKQKVANIEPGKRIDLSISFFNPLQFRDGEFEFVFPTVVGPRFNPPGHRDGIRTVGRKTHNKSGQSTDIYYLKSNESSAHNISINVDIDAGVSIEKVYSRSHVINVDKKNPSHAIISLSPYDRVPNKDFVLKYKTSGHELKTAMMTHKGEDGAYFSLLLQPPENLKNLPRMAREMVFVLDCSGSMSGKPIAKAKQAVRRALRNLDANDTFQVVGFSFNSSTLGPTPITATPENVEKGLQYLDSLGSGGGTLMIEGIRAALDFPHDENRLRIVSFMTDGFIGNEAEILAAIHEKLGESRIFSFGVGSSVNRYLLERMAVMGRGAVAYVGLDESSGEAVDRFYDVATRPALANIDIDWGDLGVTDVYPEKIPDLFVGRPVMITGKFRNNNPGRIVINGKTGDEQSQFDIAVNPNSSNTKHPGIRSVWARWKLAELSNQETYSASEDIKNEIITTSINYNLISRHTAFLSVDSLIRTKGDQVDTVDIPVPLPDGTRYDAQVAD